MLRITKQTDYGVVLLTYMAEGAADAVFTTRDLSAACGLPQPMVSKILKLLAKAELLSSQRGVRGGYRLSRPPERVSLAEIIEALEGPIALVECVDESASACSIECKCRTRINWQRINRMVLATLEGITLSEMIDPPCSYIAGFPGSTAIPLVAGRDSDRGTEESP